MVAISRGFVRLALLLSILAAGSSAIQAQEIRDRQVTPAYDFATMQMPVEIVSIRLNGKDIGAGEKIQGGENWLRGVSFTLKNISDQPISFINVGFKFPLPNGFVVVGVLNYGFDSSHGEIRREPLPPAIQPGQTHELVLTKERYDSFLYVLAQANAPSNFDVAPYFIERVSFENQPDVIWQGGYLKRRNPSNFSRFDVFERYVLPARQR